MKRKTLVATHGIILVATGLLMLGDDVWDYLGVLFLTCLAFWSVSRWFVRPAPKKNSRELINDVENLRLKTQALEGRISELKDENTSLKNSLNGSLKEPAPDPKLSLIMNERVFLHGLANRVQELQSSVVVSIKQLQGSKNKRDAEILRQLEGALQNIEKISQFIRENRDYLIIAS
jgi:hypothetical protein